MVKKLKPIYEIMKTKLLFLITLISLNNLSATTYENQTSANNPSENEMTELVLIQTKYGNNSKGIPALHYAITKNDVKAIDLLLKYGANPLIEDNIYNSCLFWAIRSDNVNLIDKFTLIEYGPDNIDLLSNWNYQQTLRSSLEFGQLEAAKHLLKKGYYTSNTLEDACALLICPHETDRFFSIEQKKELILRAVMLGLDLDSKNILTSKRIKRLVSSLHAQIPAEMIDFLRSLGAE